MDDFFNWILDRNSFLMILLLVSTIGCFLTGFALLIHWTNGWILWAVPLGAIVGWIIAFRKYKEKRMK